MATKTTTYSWSDQFRSSFQEIEVNPLEEGATTLMYACQQENVEQLRLILKKKPETIRERDRTLKTVLHYCAENSTLNCAEVVLNAASDLLDVCDEDGYTILHLAVIAGNVLLVNFLISKSADVNKLDAEKHSVIHWATVCGEVELLQILLKNKANPSTPDVHGGYPIHYAAQMCGTSSEIGTDSRLGLAVLKVLIEHNIGVDVADHDGRQPLLWAASAGSSDAVLALINAGASVQASDKDGLTALHCAASRGHTDCLETLIQLCGANVDVIDNNGCSALFYSVTLGHADATHLLLQCGADPNRQDRKGRTPAHCGAAKGQFETLKILKKYNGNLWARNAKGDYCLHEAVNAGRKDLVKWLLVQRPDAVNSSNADGRCPLHIAAITNNIEMCKILLDYQSLVNPVMRTTKDDMMTPLDAALRKGNRACAKYLQLHGGVPANKLTSYSAALRGPRRMESHSDYHASDDKLETPFQCRGSRSLDTSPCGYQTTKSRKVQVLIKANVSSKSIGKTNVYSDTINCTYEQTGRKNHRHTKNSGIVTKNTEENNRELYLSRSSSLDSNFSDIYDRSSENDCRKKRRRRKRRKSKYYDNERRDRPESRKQEVETFKKIPSPSHQHLVTAVVHSEQEPDNANKKKSESSENGFQEIQYQKLEVQGTDIEVFSDGNKSDEIEKNSVANDENILGSENKNLPNSSTDIFGEQPFVSEFEESKPSDMQNEIHTPSTSDIVNVDESQCSNTDNKKDLGEIAESKTEDKKNTENESNFEQIIHKINHDEIETKKDEPDLKTFDSNVPPPYEEIVNIQQSEQSYDLNDDERLTKKNPVVRHENENHESHRLATNESNYPPKDVLNSAINQLSETINETYGEKQLEETFTKDKGLICVILDDDETIEIKRRKDNVKVRTGTEHSRDVRTRSANRKKEKNVQKRQHRSRSSFEVLSDDENKNQFSRLGIHDDSGFEPSPRHAQSTFEDIVPHKGKSRIPRATSRIQLEKQKENDPNFNVTSVTQAVQNSLRKYHLERRIFHTLLELKRLQIRAGKSNEQILVKRLVDDYQKAGLIVGLGQYDGIYSFRHFERYLYEQLRLLQSANKKDIPRIKSTDDFERLTKALKKTRAGKTLLENIPDNPLFCTHGTHRCIHATHAYTGIPCAAYITKVDHHSLPKITTNSGENYRCFLPRIDVKPIHHKNASEIARSLKNVDPSKPVTLELIHGSDKQIISLPTEKLDKNKRYYVTFTIKGANTTERSSSEGEKMQESSFTNT